MNIKKFNRARDIRGRIHDLNMLLSHLNQIGIPVRIEGYSLPKYGEETLKALCQKEINDLEQEFEKL